MPLGADSRPWLDRELRSRRGRHPDDVAREIVVDNVVVPRPDLVYAEGYVRRRMSNPKLPKIKGTGLFELSDPGGVGCSGGPVFKRRGPRGDWPLIGVYVGEHLNDDGVFVGYAAMEERFRDWSPAWLQRSVLAESRSEA